MDSAQFEVEARLAELKGIGAAPAPAAVEEPVSE